MEKEIIRALKEVIKTQPHGMRQANMCPLYFIAHEFVGSGRPLANFGELLEYIRGMQDKGLVEVQEHVRGWDVRIINYG